MDEDDDLDDDERMQIQGNINFPKQGLPTRKGDEEESAPHAVNNQEDDEGEEDDERYMQEMIKQ